MIYIFRNVMYGFLWNTNRYVCRTSNSKSCVAILIKDDGNACDCLKKNNTLIERKEYREEWDEVKNR